MGGGREAQEQRDIYILLADSCCKAIIFQLKINKSKEKTKALKETLGLQRQYKPRLDPIMRAMAVIIIL